MNRRELIRAVAAHTADDVKHVEALVSGLTDVITAVVAKGEAVTIQGFAKFAKVERAARMGRNPRTGEAIRIKASKRVRVSPMKAFKDTVMAPNQAPRLASGVYPTSPDLLTKQAAARKASATKAPATKASPARKAAGKKTTARRAPAKRPTARKVARTTARPATKRTAKKTTAKRAPAKRAAAKKTTAKRTAKRTARR
jgi:DNA-binding protein HU-beta